MELVVAVNPTSFSDEEFSSIAGALAELKSRRAIPKNRKLKLVRTTRVESIAWFKKHDSDEKASEDGVLRAVVKKLDCLNCAAGSGHQAEEASEGRAFGIDFRRPPVSLLILVGRGKVPLALEDTFLRLLQSCNLSLVRAGQDAEDGAGAGGVAQTVARITRAFSKDADPLCPYVPEDKCEVDLNVDPPLGLFKLWSAQWSVICKSSLPPQSKKVLLDGLSPQERRSIVLADILRGETDEADINRHALLREMLFSV